MLTILNSAGCASRGQQCKQRRPRVSLSERDGGRGQADGQPVPPSPQQNQVRPGARFQVHSSLFLSTRTCDNFFLILH